MSLVVPACADTIARSSFSKVFIRLDFPTFGAPIKAIFSPLLSLSPVIPFSRSFSIFFINKDVFLIKLFFCAFSETSPSSEKSNKASISALIHTSSFLHSKYFLESSPFNKRKDCILCSLVSEAIKSARPSTSKRSIFPLIKALLVNSPGSAGLKPLIEERNKKTSSTTAVEPWRWSSTSSSPVTLSFSGK